MISPRFDVAPDADAMVISYRPDPSDQNEPIMVQSRLVTNHMLFQRERARILHDKNQSKRWQILSV